MKITLQKTDDNDTEQRLFDASTENSRLHDTICMLQWEIERLLHAAKSGKIIINVKQMQVDLSRRS